MKTEEIMVLYKTATAFMTLFALSFVVLTGAPGSAWYAEPTVSVDSSYRHELTSRNPEGLPARSYFMLIDGGIVLMEPDRGRFPIETGKVEHVDPPRHVFNLYAFNAEVSDRLKLHKEVRP
jgi:hypothetical protein